MFYVILFLYFRCEILPGPQFILRRYHFLRNGKFHLTRFYYSDPWCSSAAFSVTVVGNFHPAAEKATSSSASWVVPGGLELDYTLKKMTLVPFTITEAITLSNKVNNSCPGIVMGTWKPYKKYKVLNYEQNHSRLVSWHPWIDAILVYFSDIFLISFFIVWIIVKR